MNEQLWRKGPQDLASLISRGDVSSREVIQSHIDRIDEVNPHLNAIVRRMDQAALEAADRADQHRRDGIPLGPLHGVPFTIKENIDVAGTPTTQAVPTLAEAFSTSDAPVVERMKNAGAIPLARTNLPDMGLRIHTDSSLHGLTKNPWNPERTTGGSSGGEASALASGMSPIGLGNDIGGSLRNPAHCCGIASIKPTVGVIPFATEIPPTALGLGSQLMLVQGVLARRVTDVRLGFDIVRGAHHRDPFSYSATLNELAIDRPLRIAVMAEAPGGRTDAGIAAVVRSSASFLESLGHVIEEAVPPRFEEAVEMWGALLNYELSPLQPLLEAVMGDGARQFLEFGRESFTTYSPEQMIFMHASRFEIAMEWAAWFQTYDVMLSPTWSLPAFTHGFDIAGSQEAHEVLETFRTVLPQNFLGSPAVVVPAGIADGLPVGVQVSAWRNDDLKCLAVAEIIDSAMGISTPIEPVH